jgi:hypothetical protein
VALSECKKLARHSTYPHLIISSPATRVMLARSLAQREATMHDLPQLLLAHLQHEAKDAREPVSREEYEEQIPASYQQLDECRTLSQCLKMLNYEI